MVKLRERLWRLWAQIRAWAAAWCRERLISLLRRVPDDIWNEVAERQYAANYGYNVLRRTGLAASDKEAERLSWEMGRRLHQLHEECERRKGARAP